MAKEKFLLVNLKEDQAKRLAQAIQNDSCRQILDFLADKDGTESDIAKQLGQPLSTIHYNLQLLMKAGLVTVEEYHYSPKGREVNHYKLANKFIIIAPQSASTFNLQEKLKSLLPAGLIAIMGGALFQLYKSFSIGVMATAKMQSPSLQAAIYSENTANAVAVGAGQNATDAAVQTAANIAADSAATLTQAAQDTVNQEGVGVASRAMMKVVEENSSNALAQGNSLGMQNASEAAGREIVNSATSSSAQNHLSQFQQITQPHEPNYFIWITIGVLVTLGLILLIQYIQYKRSLRRE